jgi:hypothetical protein
MSDTIQINWKYKFERADFSDENKRKQLEGKGGVYLWVRKGGAIWYVGETEDYLPRFKEHFINQIGGRYWVFELKDNNRKWPGDNPYEPSQLSIFENIATLDQRRNLFNRAYEMFENSYFLFGEMTKATNKEIHKVIREEAEGKLLRFFYDNYYKDQEGARKFWLLGKVKRNPTGKYVFSHNETGHCLHEIREFYRDDEDFPLKIPD